MPSNIPTEQLEHGTIQRFNRGCRCADCREARNLGLRVRRANPATIDRKIDASEVCRRLNLLIKQYDFSFPELERLTGINRGQLGKLARGDVMICLSSTRDAIFAIEERDISPDQRLKRDGYDATIAYYEERGLRRSEIIGITGITRTSVYRPEAAYVTGANALKLEGSLANLEAAAKAKQQRHRDPVAFIEAYLKLGLSMKDISRASGIHYVTIQRYRKGTNSISPKNAARLFNSNVYIQLNQLAYETHHPQPIDFSSPNFPHGTTWGYQQGCRCDICREANSQQSKSRRQALVDLGDSTSHSVTPQNPLVDNVEAQKKLSILLGKGYTRESIAAALGTTTSTITGISQGQTKHSRQDLVKRILDLSEDVINVPNPVKLSQREQQLKQAAQQEQAYIDNIRGYLEQGLTLETLSRVSGISEARLTEVSSSNYGECHSTLQERQFLKRATPRLRILSLLLWAGFDKEVALTLSEVPLEHFFELAPTPYGKQAPKIPLPPISGQPEQPEPSEALEPEQVSKSSETSKLESAKDGSQPSLVETDFQTRLIRLVATLCSRGLAKHYRTIADRAGIPPAAAVHIFTYSFGEVSKEDLAKFIKFAYSLLQQ